MKTFLLFYVLLSSLALKINCQDDDYDTDPEEAINVDYPMNNEQPEFFKNAFVEPGSQRSVDQSDPWNQYLGYFPFATLGDARSYPPYYSVGGQSVPFETSSNEQTKARSNVMNDEFFNDNSEKNKDDFESDSFDSHNSKPKSTDHQMKTSSQHNNSPLPMYNYGLPMANYGAMNYGATNTRYNPYQPYPQQHPIGSNLYPYTQRK